MTPQEYLQNIFNFEGPLLSVVQAALGIFLSVLLVKVLARKWGRGSQSPVSLVTLGIVAVLIAILTVAGGAVGLWIGLPPYVYYPVPLLVSLLVPKLVFRLNWFEFLLYVILGTLLGLLTHVLFSLLVGYNNYLPFWKIDPLWR